MSELQQSAHGLTATWKTGGIHGPWISVAGPGIDQPWEFAAIGPDHPDATPYERRRKVQLRNACRYVAGKLKSE